MKKVTLTTKQKYYFSALSIFALCILGEYIYWTPKPGIAVRNQVIQNGQIKIQQINLPFNGWIILSSTKYDQPTEMIGKIRIERGRHKNIGIYVNVLRTTPRVEASVYEDETTPGIFDINTDKDVVVAGRSLKLLFDRQ